MSLGAELGFAALARTIGAEYGIALLSEKGVGSPFAAMGTVAVRLALRPSGGVHIHPAARYDPAIDVVQNVSDARRVARNSPILIDTLADQVEMMCAVASDLSPTSVSAIRVRGEVTAGTVPPDMRAVFQDRVSGDAIYLHKAVLAGPLDRHFAALSAGALDEFDLMREEIGRAAFTNMRFTTGGAEMFFAPPTALDLPHICQLDAALGAGKVVVDPALSAALVVPQLSSQPAPFGLSVRGLARGAADPTLIGLVPPDWQVQKSRYGDVWTCQITPTQTREAEFLEIRCPHDNVEVTDIWTGATRSRAAWEDWDEAGAQLDLEQRW